MSKTKCEYCEEGICTYFKSLEEQYKDEEDGLSAEYCDGNEEQEKECFGYVKGFYDTIVDDKADFVIVELVEI
jgi:hypothetical protein